MASTAAAPAANITTLMTPEQAMLAITSLERNGHHFKLLPTGQLHVTNVTAPLKAFCQRFREPIVSALATRQHEQLARANFPSNPPAKAVERKTWPQIRAEWRALTGHLPQHEMLRVLARTVGELEGDIGQAIAMRLLDEEWQGAPREVLEQLVDTTKEGR